jgi:hypothetical protein
MRLRQPPAAGEEQKAEKRREGAAT